MMRSDGKGGFPGNLQISTITLTVIIAGKCYINNMLVKIANRFQAANSQLQGYCSQ